MASTCSKVKKDKRNKLKKARLLSKLYKRRELLKRLPKKKLLRDRMKKNYKKNNSLPK